MAPTLTPAYRVRPLLVGDILDEAFRIYRARFGLMLGSALVASIPGILVGLGGGAQTIFGAYLQTTLGSTSRVDSAGLNPGLLALIAAGVVLGILVYPVTASMPHFAASAAALGLPATPGSILRHAFRNYFRLWVLALANVVMSALVLLVFPVYFLVRWSFVYQVFYLERAGVGGAFNRSARLTTNSWWRVFGIRLLARVIVSVIAFVLGILVSLPTLLVPGGGLRQSIAGLLGALVTAVLLPFGALVLTLLYLDQRVRLEALDLQLMASHAGSQPGPALDQPASSF